MQRNPELLYVTPPLGIAQGDAFHIDCLPASLDTRYSIPDFREYSISIDCESGFCNGNAFICSISQYSVC